MRLIQIFQTTIWLLRILNRFFLLFLLLSERQTITLVSYPAKTTNPKIHSDVLMTEPLEIRFEMVNC